ENIIVCSKPPFMITHPAGKHLFYCATVYYESIHNKTIHSIHRLDRETSGLLVLGKNSVASNEISNQFEEGLVKKCYLLIAHKEEIRSTFPFTANERINNEDIPI